MQRRYATWLQVLVLAFFFVQLCGCPAAFFAAGAGAGAGAGAMAYLKGDLVAKVDHTTNRTYQAALKALVELKLPVIEKEGDVVTAKITSRFADEKDVWIKINALNETTCEMSIRVGIFGDFERSRKILNTTKKYL